MGLWEHFTSFFRGDQTLELDVMIAELSGEIIFKQIAIETCINLISKTLGRCEFRTYKNGKEVKQANYYLFNVEPNKNQSATTFWNQVVSKMIKDNECLVVQFNKQLFIADDYEIIKNGVNENRYKNIKINDVILNEEYKESDVLQFKLHSSNIKTLIDSMNMKYGKLIESASRKYKKDKAKRGVYEIPVSYPQTEKAREDLTKLITQHTKNFFNAETGAALPLTNGIKFKEIENNKETLSRDIRNLIDDVFDFVAIAFQIPPQLIKGGVADTTEIINQFLMFGFSTFQNTITNEIDRKMFKKDFLNGSKVVIDSTRVKYIDLTDISNVLEVLTRIGAHSINDNLKLLGMETIDKPWANKRFMTKNYDDIENF